MGEYALYKGQEIKIGTCENMYYLRFNQRNDVVPLPGNVNPATQVNELWFRVPRHEEDGVAPGDFEYAGDSMIRFLIKDKASRFANEVEELAYESEGIAQVVHPEMGVLCNIPCYHGYKADLPKGMFYNGFAPHTLGVQAVGIRHGRAAALVSCTICGRAFMYVTLEELVRYCTPFGDEKNWEYLLQTMLEIEASLWLDNSRFNSVLNSALIKAL